MNRIKILLIFVLVIVLSFSLLGCKLLPWGDSAADETATIAALPQWLTLEHRAEAAEEPEIAEEEAAEEEEESAETPAQTATTQPATTQPAPATSSEPAWKKPGTMEFLGKIQLDEAVKEYKNLAIRYNNADRTSKEDIKKRMTSLQAGITEVAEEIGVNIKQEYGITFPSSGADAQSIWDSMGSPSGFAD